MPATEKVGKAEKTVTAKTGKSKGAAVPAASYSEMIKYVRELEDATTHYKEQLALSGEKLTCLNEASVPQLMNELARRGQGFVGALMRPPERNDGAPPLFNVVFSPDPHITCMLISKLMTESEKRFGEMGTFE